MKIRELGILGALEFSPQIFSDDRGSFREWFNLQKIKQDIDFSFPVVQGNISHSKLGVIRGVHFSNSTKGQDKFVTCISGEIVDVLIDLRLGSPTYLVKEYVSLCPTSGKSIYIPTGVGHGFVSKAEESIVCYLLTSEYDPQTEQAIYPFDVELDINWNTEKSIISERDTSAQSLSEARVRGLLHSY
jgi:dTDP-4-dehydrorhamnose 3,5-epimerase